jgi:hypothetical protein
MVRVRSWDLLCGQGVLTGGGRWLDETFEIEGIDGLASPAITI